ncbi:MAG: TolC family protein [Salibacteraceae bacterium]
MSKITGVVLALLLAIQAGAQDTLRLDKAIEIALEKNHRIKIAKDQVEIAKNLATPGNANLLPTVSANASGSYGENNTRLELVNSPVPIEAQGAASINTSASINLNYTLFSGFSNRLNYKKLQLAYGSATALERTQVENTLLSVITAYFNAVRAQDNFKAIEQTLSVSRERVIRSEAAVELTGANRLSYYNALVDFNQDSVSFLNARQVLQASQATLNQLLALPIESIFTLDTIYNIPQLPPYSDLVKNMKSQNPEIVQKRLDEQTSLINLKIARSAYSPTLNLSGSYAYNRSESEGSFLLSNQSLGYTVGLNLSLPIYSGGRRTTAINNARIQQEISALQYEEMELNLEKELYVAYQDFQTTSKALVLEKMNLQTAEKNFQLTQERYLMGQVSGIDFRTAQINLLLARNNFSNLKYNLYLSALEVLRLSGNLTAELQ